DGVDLVLNRQMRRGRGMNLNSDNMHGPNPNAFGHSGAGGSTGFADPDLKLGIGYAMNQMETNLDGDTRVARLTRAVYHCLKAR
ncbi:MAG: serine hydrolase, partial [Proteobacteria bacterium]|nr:serine hydrolase [Pseudomonadota bacterium]